MKGGKCTKEQNLFPMLTEVQENLPSARGKLKANFLQSDRLLQDSRIKDLEKTLRINKEMITSLIDSNAKLDSNSKSICAQLNEENTFLQNQIKVLKKQRDDYHSKWLIGQQIVEECKAKEEELELQFQEKLGELREELKQKEYAAQNIQHKYNKAENILKKYSSKEKEICLLLRELNADTQGECRKITNVIEENQQLTAALHAASKKIENLESRLSEKGESYDVPQLQTKKPGISYKQEFHEEMVRKTEFEQLISLNQQLCARIQELERTKMSSKLQDEVAGVLMDTAVDSPMMYDEGEVPEPDGREEAGQKLGRAPSIDDISCIIKNIDAALRP